MKQFALLLFLGLSIISCKQDLSSDEQHMYEQVMVIHDEVMPKISTMNRLQSKLEKALPTAAAGPEMALVKKNIGDLTAASDLMFEWMQNFKKKKDMSENQDYLKYLNSEEVRIQKVSDAMLSSIAAAENLIEKMK